MNFVRMIIIKFIIMYMVEELEVVIIKDKLVISLKFVCICL